jgi:hypothetical protein
MPRLDLESLMNRHENTNINQDILDMNIVSQAIIEAGGDLDLVAERLLGSKQLQDQVLSLISSDQVSLDIFAAKIRAFSLVKTMSIFNALSYRVMMAIPDLKPEESIKAFSKIADVMERMTKNQTQQTNNINIFETIMSQVPPSVAKALKEAITIQQEATPVVINQAPEEHV